MDFNPSYFENISKKATNAPIIIKSELAIPDEFVSYLHTNYPKKIREFVAKKKPDLGSSSFKTKTN
jgi:hypothetical protein